MQIQNELLDANPNIQFCEQEVNLGIDKDKLLQRTISIEKTDEILERINQKLTQTGLSATAINTYLSCPLKFYFRYIANHQKPLEVVESLDAQRLGTILHEVLKLIYEPKKNEPLTSDFLNAQIKQLPTLISQALDQHYQHGDTSAGKNLLIKTISQTYLENFLKNEIINCKNLIINDLEQDLSIPEYSFLNEYDVSQSIKLTGKVDRIDTYMGQKRIIDYKTGSFQQSDITIKSIKEAFEPEQTKEKAVQLLFYALLYKYQHGNGFGGLLSSIYSFRKNKPSTDDEAENRYFCLEVGSERNGKKQTIDHNMLDEFETELKQLIKQIYNATHPFVQTKDLKSCKYCDFSDVCNRS